MGYRRGVSPAPPALRYPTVVHALRSRAASTPHTPAYLFLGDGEGESERRTWSELDARARAVAASLRGEGAPGDRVVLAVPEGLDFLDAWFGCLYARRLPVPVHAPEAARWERTAPRLRAVAADAGAALILTAPSLVDAVARAVPGARVAATGLEPPSPAPPDPVAPDDLAFLQYTSGSTAEPKGVMLTHHHLAWQLTDFDLGYDHREGDTLVSWLPATHDLGMVYGRLMALWAGMRCVAFSPEAFVQRPLRWVRALSRYGATHSAAPNFAYELVARRATPEDLAGIDLSAVKVLVNGAEPIRPESEAAFVAALRPCGLRPSALTHALGMSETTAKIATEPAGRETPRFLWLDPAAYERDLVVPVPPETPGARPVASTGAPQLDTRVVAVDPETREPLAEDRVGELWVAGTTVASGYWGRPGLTEETFRARTAAGDGPYLRTGDLGFLHGGEVYVSGRRKDVVIVRGQNHHPADLERLLEATHPAVRPGGVVVVGVPGPEGEGIGAVIEALPDAPLDEVVARAREVLSDQGLAAQVLALVPPRTLPRTTSGKHARTEVRRRLLTSELPCLRRVDVTREPARARSPGIRDRLRAAPPRRRPALLEQHLLDLAAARLGVDPRDLDPDRPFKELGLDSVAAVALVEEAARSVGVELPGTALFDHPTAAAMAAHLLGKVEV